MMMEGVGVAAPSSYCCCCCCRHHHHHYPRSLTSLTYSFDLHGFVMEMGVVGCDGDDVIRNDSGRARSTKVTV
jgi:hypothetical protein